MCYLQHTKCLFYTLGHKNFVMVRNSLHTKYYWKLSFHNLDDSLPVNWSNHAKYECNKSVRDSGNPGMGKGKQINKQNMSVTKVKIRSFHTIGLVRLILAIFLHDNMRDYPNVLFFFNKQGSPDYGQAPSIAKSLPWSLSFISPVVLLFLPVLNPSGPFAVLESGSAIPQAAEYTQVCRLLRRRPHPGFFLWVNTRIVSHLPLVRLPSSVASLKDPTCICSALPLLTPWILQSPNQTPASHFPSWVSELREWRDSGTCLSIKRTPGCCLPFVFWWWRDHRHRAICFISWLDFKQNVLGVSLSGLKALQLGSLLLKRLYDLWSIPFLIPQYHRSRETSRLLPSSEISYPQIFTLETWRKSLQTQH